MCAVSVNHDECLLRLMGFLSDDVTVTGRRLQRHLKCNSFFTPPTRTRQNCLVLSASTVWTQWDKTRQFCLVSTQFPICNCSVSNILRITENLEIGNCLILSCLQLCLHRRHGQDKTVLSCSCWRCEQAIRVVLTQQKQRVNFWRFAVISRAQLFSCRERIARKYDAVLSNLLSKQLFSVKAKYCTERTQIRSQ